jgi:ubiquinone biosynthesis UbiH/UbiF/VisC/COQ6 family hydroxylase
MKVWDDFGTGVMHFEQSRGWVVENSAIVYANMKRLQDFSQVELLTETAIKRISPGTSCVTIELENGRLITSPLVVGAEGKDSSVRQSFGIGTWNWSYPHHGLTCVVKVEQPNGQAHQRFLKSGPIALLPLWDDYVSVVWSMSPYLMERMQSIPETQFLEELNRAIHLPSTNAFPFQPASIQPVTVQSLASKRLVFPYSMQHARNYITHRAALIGDSAHTLHPMAGQGFNLGLYDSINLAYELCKAAELGKDLGSVDVLDKYQARSRSYNLTLAAFEQALLVLYGDHWPLNYVRNIGMSVISSLAPLKVRTK